jgi:H+/Cl- antiporter ClcA
MLNPERVAVIVRNSRRVLRARVGARKTLSLAVLVVASIAAGGLAVGFAKLCDWADGLHRQLAAALPWAPFAILPIAFVLATWLTRAFAPASAGSGIPQVIAAAEHPAPRGVDDPRLSWRTAVFKALMCAALLACGASIGREGPTVQIAAAAVTLGAGLLRRGPNRRSIAIAGGAAGVAAAFNTPIAGVVFGVEELAKGFDRRTNTVVILVVVAAGVASFAIAGDYAYFGQNIRAGQGLMTAWLTAPVLGVVCGAAGGLFSKLLLTAIGPGDGAVTAWRRARPLAFAAICGLAASAAAFISGGLTYGTGYGQARRLLAGDTHDALSLGVFKWISNLAAAACGAPGGIFSPALTAGAGIGAAVDRILPFGTAHDAIVLGMACYLSGVVQAPLTSAVILMEMTRDPVLVGPLMLGAWLARAVSARISPQPVYHVLARIWRTPHA